MACRREAIERLLLVMFQKVVERICPPITTTTPGKRIRESRTNPPAPLWGHQAVEGKGFKALGRSSLEY